MSKKTVQTIEDIARLANVSKSTVSRALNDSPLIKLETRERIQAIAREHNFRINAPARNLSMRQSCTIAFVTHAYHLESFSMEDLFGLEIMGGISSGLHSLGYDLLIVHVNPRDIGWAHQYLDSGRVDGFILMTASRKQNHIKTLVEMGAPFIVWGIPAPKVNYCSVTGDNITGGRLATEHLIRTGRQRIAFLGGPPKRWKCSSASRATKPPCRPPGAAWTPTCWRMAITRTPPAVPRCSACWNNPPTWTRSL